MREESVSERGSPVKKARRVEGDGKHCHTEKRISLMALQKVKPLKLKLKEPMHPRWIS
jgi:hypothetical protein